MDERIASSPYIIYALLIVGVLTIFLGAIGKGTTGLGAWLSSLRRIGSDAKAADILQRDLTIANLSADLGKERKARQADRQYFEHELTRRDELSRAHTIWDWQVYNVLVRAGLWDKSLGDGPPKLF